MYKEKVDKTIQKYKLIEENDHILIGLSGGKDSIFLLHMVLGLKEKYKIKISIGHFNHKTRKDLSDRDENFCINLAKDLGLDFYSDSYSMEDYAREKKISDEEAGRILRREFFKNTMEISKANKLALGHNWDDQVETVLMRIIRGTGIDGLEGIEYKSDYIIRPILDIKRSSIDKYIKEEEISYVEDHTNFENIYQRNKIRNLLIPYLESNYNPKIKNSISKLSKSSAEDKNYLAREAKKAYSKTLAKKDGKKIYLDNKILQALDPAISTRVIRYVFEDLNGQIKNISYDNIKSILSLSKKESGKEIDNIADLRIYRSYDYLVFDKYNKSQDSDYYKILDLGINYVYEDSMLQVDEVSKKVDDGALYIPKSIIEDKLVLRSREPGDRIKLKNLNGRKKIKDILIDDKVPRSKRQEIILLADDKEIYWIIGNRRADIDNISDDSYIRVDLIDGGN